MDWKTIITDIKIGLGMTQVQIAHRVGISQTSVSELENGKTKEPGYAIGRSLVDLHRRARRKLKHTAEA
jgi:transcriptional regulator with XRE-family HTH domain